MHWLRRPIIEAAVVIALFALGAWILFLPLGLADSQHLPGCACNDQALQVWFLAADHYAVVHHHFSLLSTRLDYPSGVNLMDNTSMLLLGVLATPLFSAVGPVGVFVLLMRLGFLLSATSCFLVLRRYVRSVFAAAVGGLLYGFGPYMTHQGEQHLFLVFVPIPPILFLLVEHHVFAGRRRLGLGVALGVLAAAQYFISSEVLVSAALLLGVTVVILAAWEVVRRRRASWSRLRGAAPTLAATVAVVVVVLGYPAWFALEGAQHIVGPSQQSVPGIDVVNTILPATTRLLAGRWPGLMRPAFVQQGDMAFIGIPLLVVLVGVVVAMWRRPVVRFAGIFGGAAWVLALGPRLIIDGRDTTIPLPFALLQRLPLVQDLIPSRLMLFGDLAAAVILAVGVDRLVSLPPRSGGAHGRRRSRAVGPAAATVVAALGLVFVIPVTGYAAAGTTVADQFLDGAATRQMPPDGVALTYPYPVPPEARAMIWQADSGLSFSLLGGYALRPFTNPRDNKLPAMLPPKAVQDLLLHAWPAKLPGSTAASFAVARAELPVFVAEYHVTTILVDEAGADPQLVVALCRRVYGAPQRYGKLLVWADLTR